MRDRLEGLDRLKMRGRLEGLASPEDPGPVRSLLEGRIEGTSVPELIHGVCASGGTGTLAFSRGALRKNVHLIDGRIVFAASNAAEDRLGERLLRAGQIGYREFEEARVQLSGGSRLGAILVAKGFLSPEGLVRGVIDQVREIVLELFPWERGSYAFVEGDTSSSEVITLDVGTAQLIYDGVRRIVAWPRIVAAVGSHATVYRLAPGARRTSEGLRLGAAERLILDMLEEPVTIGGICRGVFLPNFEVYQTLWALRILDVAREVESPSMALSTGASGERQGSLEQEGFGQVLLNVCRERESGILCVARGGEEKAVHIDRGKVVFATSNQPEDNLTSYLLRRGVIGSRDRDDVETRLLSNKRAGTILREIGILTQAELERFVEDQLREIVLSLFGWDQGEWRFLRGELPRIEAPVLDGPVEDWVLRGVRRVGDWSRIREGCGPLDTLLRPAESPSAALAGVDLAADESEILSLIQGPMTVEQICGAVRIPDCRVAEILWALQMIGALVRGALAGAETPALEQNDPAETIRIPAPAAEGAESDEVGEDAAAEPGPATALAGGHPSVGSQDGGAATPRADTPPQDGDTVQRDYERAPRADNAPAVMSAGTVEGDPSVVPQAGDESSSPPQDRPFAGGHTAESIPAHDPRAAALRAEIVRFNACHAEIFRVMKQAVGAGARNTVATCARRVGGIVESTFSGLPIRDSGRFEEAKLFQRLRTLAPDEVRPTLVALLRAEHEFAAAFLDAASIERLSGLVAKAEASEAEAELTPVGAGEPSAR